MLTAMIRPGSRALAAARGALFATMLAAPAAAQAQSFTLPQECQNGATGAEGDDPVVILRDNYLNRSVDNFTLIQLSDPPVVEWGITIAPFRGGQSGYSIFTTYTPFLYSSALVAEPSYYSSYNVTLPRPGVMAGRKTAVHDNFTLTVMYGSQTVPYAFVDFIPDFVGSSPLTMQADGNGQIVLYCVQQTFDGYNITVSDQNHNYLYDGSFVVGGGSLEAAADGAARGESRPHPEGFVDEDEPE